MASSNFKQYERLKKKSTVLFTEKNTNVTMTHLPLSILTCNIYYPRPKIALCHLSLKSQKCMQKERMN